MSGKKVIIIGAGISGLAAARELLAAGYEVQVLEARERIGGRTHTDSSLGVDFDLGAAWIHGPHGNPITPLAKQFGVTWGTTDFNNESGKAMLAFDKHGRALDMTAYTRGMNQYRGGTYQLFGSILCERPPESCQSYADLLAFGLPNVDPESMEPDERLGYEYAAVIRPQYEDNSDMVQMDWRLGGAYLKLPGGDYLLYGGGFKKIVDGLAEGVAIALNTAVSHIRYTAEGVTITTSAGDTHTADHVVVTVPLGVLKAGQISFDPPLPEAKQGAIERIGFGVYEKIALKFPHIFWPLEPERINYVNDDDPQLFTSWLNNAHYTGQPILAAYHAGSRARYINEWDDDQLIAACMAVLRKLFGDDIPEPVAYARSSWQKDPYSQGAYSFAQVGQQPEDQAALAEPLHGRVFFAGEALHPNYFGTVHGAYETGLKAARTILEVN